MSKSTALSAAPPSLIRPMYPGLDGLRAIAFLLVFAIHEFPLFTDSQLFKWGWVGVDIFFVLSGFLITGILYDSLNRTQFFRNFYIRRILRIFPLFYGFWLFLFLATPLFHFQWNHYNLATALYVGNFLIAATAATPHTCPGLIFFRSPHIFPQIDHFISIGPYWSLCVEEQFYLLWPLVIWLVRKPAALLRICFSVIIAMPFLREYMTYAHPHFWKIDGIYSSSFFRMDTLLMGGAIALWLRMYPPPITLLRRCASVVAIAAPAVLLTVFYVHRNPAYTTTNSRCIVTFGFTLTALAAGALLLLAIDPQSIVYKFIQNKHLAALGRISYGLYFFHEIPQSVFVTVAAELKPMHLAFLVPIAAFAWTWCAATLSYRYLETPFLRLKSRLTAPSQPIKKTVTSTKYPGRPISLKRLLLHRSKI